MKKLLLKLSGLMLVLSMAMTSLPVYAMDDDSSESTTEYNENSSESEEETNPNARWGIYYHNNGICEYVIDELNLTDSQGEWIKETCKAAADIDY